MRRRNNWIAILAMLPMVMSLTACDAVGFRILIPDYDVSNVSGLKLWTEDASGFTERIALTFDETVEAPVGEVVMYGFIVDGEDVGVTMPALVQRDSEDRVTLSINLLTFAGRDEYHISTFNEFGDSPLAEGSFTL